MSGTPPTIEWYIARDQAQHGPISDVEMRKFVELGHLKATDLVWCARFTAWQPASQAFPEHFQPNQTPSPAAPPVAQPAAVSPAGSVAPAAVESKAAATSPATRSPDDAAWADAMRAVVGGTTPAAASASPSRESKVPAAGYQDYQPSFTAGGAPAAHATVPSFEPAFSDSALTGDQRLDYARDEDLDDPAPKRSWIGTATVVLATALILGGLGWFGWQNRALVTGASAIGNIIATATSTGPSIDHLRTAPYHAPGETKDEIDASLQKIAVWRYLKREFAEWYGERVVEVERMRAQKRDERAVTQYLVDVIVTLRRRNAPAALQSSPENLRAMAAAFIGNLKQLGSRDGATCYAFITHGELSPFMIELSRTPAFSETLQRQMIAVFEAIVDARGGRKIHAAATRSDFGRLTQDLTKNHNWTDQDLSAFSDPQKLALTIPDKVCKLVQDWFGAQLEIKEADQQTRLLTVSLKPLVEG